MGACSTLRLSVIQIILFLLYSLMILDFSLKAKFLHTMSQSSPWMWILETLEKVNFWMCPLLKCRYSDPTWISFQYRKRNRKKLISSNQIPSRPPQQQQQQPQQQLTIVQTIIEVKTSDVIWYKECCVSMKMFCCHAKEETIVETSTPHAASR